MDPERQPLETVLDIYQQRDRRQWQALGLLVTILTVSLVANAVLGVRMTRATEQVGDVAEDTQVIVEDIRRRTSPENQRAQQALINELLAKIDCSQREALQDVVDGLVEQNILPPGSVGVVLDTCLTLDSTTTPGRRAASR